MCESEVLWSVGSHSHLCCPMRCQEEHQKQLLISNVLSRRLNKLISQVCGPFNVHYRFIFNLVLLNIMYVPLWGPNRFWPGSGLVLRCLGPGFTVRALSPGFRPIFIHSYYTVPVIVIIIIVIISQIIMMIMLW